MFLKSMLDAAMRPRCGPRGQVLPFVAIGLFAILGMMALAVDVGYYRYQQRVEQTAADSAAIAGAIALLSPTATCQPSPAPSPVPSPLPPVPQYFACTGQADAATNGFVDDGGVTTSVTMNHPPQSGPYAGNANAVEAIVLKKQPVFFSGIFAGASFESVSARAVAAPSGAGHGCVYALNAPAGPGILINGAPGGFQVPNCGVVSNGDFTVNGNATVVNALEIGYAGNGPKQIRPSQYPQATPGPIVAASDPCVTIPGCAYLAAHPPANPGVAAVPPTFNNGVTTYQPGEYAATLKPASPAVFAAGLYVFDMGFTTTGNATISGTGVTFYNRGGALTISGNTSVNLSAPATGNYAGIVFYQPSANMSGDTFNGAAGTIGFSGALYAPTAPLTLNGNLPQLTTVISDSLTINGNGIAVGGTGAPTGLLHFVLAE